MPKQQGRPEVKAEHAQLLTLGVPRDPKRMRVQLKRACGLLQRNGFAVGITSPETILLHAKLIEEQKANQQIEEESTDGG